MFVCSGLLVFYITINCQDMVTRMGLLPDTYNCGLRMRRERFSRHRRQRKPLVSDTGMHQDTCVTHMYVPWCMSGSVKRSCHSSHKHSPQFYVSGKRAMGFMGLPSRLSTDFDIRGCKCWCIPIDISTLGCHNLDDRSSKLWYVSASGTSMP